MKLLANILFIFCTSVLLFGQTNDNLLSLQNLYEAFEYSTVINFADNLLLDKERYSDETLIQIFELKAASYFAMNDQLNSRKSFLEILKKNNEYEIDNITYSPKLVSFFKNVKIEFLDILSTEKDAKNSHEINKIIEQNTQFVSKNDQFRTSLAKSLILPGWGHLNNNSNTKGWILTSASAITLSSMVYFIFDVNSKENDYLASTNTTLINTNYDKYNKSYKIRNTLIAAYAAIWLYSQIDLFFFSENLQENYISVNVNNVKNINPNENILISLQIPF